MVPRALAGAHSQVALLGIPATASLFFFAAALFAGVPIGMTALLLPLAAAAVWWNTRVLAESRVLSAYGFLLALKLILLVYQVHGRNLPLSGVDWVHYDRFGAELALAAGGDVGVMLTSPDWDLFTRLTAVTYTWFGTDSAQMYFLVFLSSLVTFGYLYRAAQLFLGSDRGAAIVAMVFMAWPLEVILSVTFLREMPIQMLVAASLYYFLRYWRGRGPFHLVVALALSLGAALMHSGMIVIPVAFAYLSVRDKDRGGLQLLRTVLFAVGVLVLLQSPSADPFLSKFGDFAASPGALVEPGSSPDPGAADSTTYYLSPDMSSVPLLQLPYRLVMFALSPFPWQATSFGTAISVLIEGLPRLVMVTLMVLAYWRCRTGEPRRDVLLAGVLLTVLAGYIVFSLGVSNYGTAIRHRAKFFPIEILLAYASFAARPLRLSRPSRERGNDGSVVRNIA